MNPTLLINNHTSVGGEDYHSGPYTAIIPAGNTSGSFNVGITDDNVFEIIIETFRLTINQQSLPSLVIAANPDRTTVTIRDDDGMCV